MRAFGFVGLLVLLAAGSLRAQAPTLRQSLAGHTGQISHLTFSWDGKLLASSCADQTVKVWDATTGRERFSLKGHVGWAFKAAFGPDGNTLASAGFDGTLQFWDLTSGREKMTLRAMNNQQLYAVAFAQHGRTVAFSPDGRTLATGGRDATIKLWDLNRERAK